MPSPRAPLARGLAGCLLAASLAGCAGTGQGDGESRATDASSTPTAAASPGTTSGTSPAPSGATSAPADDATPTDDARSARAGARARVVELVSMTAAGGTVTPTPTPVAGEAARAAYLADFDARARTRLRRAFAAVDAPRARGLSAAVVAIGCVPPEDVRIVSSGTARSGRTYQVFAAATRSPDVQCFAPVTTVAVLLLPA